MRRPTKLTVCRAYRNLKEAREELAEKPGYMAAVKVQMMKEVHAEHRALRLV